MLKNYKSFQLLMISALLLVCSLASAQNQVLTFNIEQSNFSNGAPLPSEENFAITGPISENVTLVSFGLYADNDNIDDRALYENYWKKSFANTEETNFYIPVNHKLKGGEEYNILINYYAKISQDEYDYIVQSLELYLGAYVDQHTQITDDKIKLAKRSSEMVSDLDDVVNNALSNYRIEDERKFKGFSDLVRSNLEAFRKNKLDEDSNGDVNHKNLQKDLDNLKMLLNYEVANYLNLGLYTMVETRFVKEYPSKETRNLVTLHAGYGGVYLDGKIDNLSYDNGGFAGITFPLGKKAFASKFWSNTAIVTGVYFQNFKNENGDKISGPIIKRPVYVGLGYKIFKFLRVAGGVTFLEAKETAGNFDNLGSNVFIRPYIGLQADLNFWADFSR